ncbi:MAG: CPBP family intramembrane metalloprotease [Lachnospiraceae bacterium]|nr:CPBP family intramembrane metalloprotease [Lachnospiraceae bacterium]
MTNTDYNRKKVRRFLLLAFGMAWLIQAFVGMIAAKGGTVVARLVIAAMMFVPALAVFMSRGDIGGMGWKPQIKKNLKLILLAWFAPLILTVIGAALYFLVFPGHFDISGKALEASAGADALAQLEAQGLTYPLYVVISAVGSITYAPLLNGVLALGEEIGWRGFLYPQLKAKFGRKKAMVLHGLIWGAWHFPLIWLIGYEYGFGYFGYPVVGMILFAVITAGWGILHSWIYEKSGSIWLPAILHGAINAAGTLPIAVWVSGNANAALLGPAPVGLLAGLPFLIFAAVIWLKARKED